MVIRTRSKSFLFLGALLASSVVAPSHAGIVCEKGLIRALSLDGGASHFTVSTGLSTTAEHGKQAIRSLFGTAIARPDNYDSFNEKFSIVKAAYATGSYIYIEAMASGADCAGTSGEFRVVVCNAANDCGA